MAETKEFKDFTVEGAIEKGLKELGLSREQVEVTVKNERTLFKMACVELRVIEPKEEVEATANEEAAQSEKTEIDEEEMMANGAIHADAGMYRECETVLEFVEGLLRRMEVHAAVTVTAKDDEMFVDISGPDAGGVIGYRGEVLDAVQYFGLLIANRAGDKFTRVTVDAEHYRRRREETLTVLAHRLEQKATRTGRKVALEPMNPFERRVIHTALQNSQSVHTNSEGEGRFRHVVIIPNRQFGGNGEEQQMTYGRSGDFRRNGMGKTRSFGNKRNRF